MKAHLVSLGCPKNLVDSEAALTVLKRAGCAITDDPGEADFLLVAACSFLDASWRETVDEVKRLARFKGSGRDTGPGPAGLHGSGKRLVLMGCLPQHRNEDLESTLPWVDYFLPTGGHELLSQLVGSWREKLNGGPKLIDTSAADRFAGFETRELLTPRHTAYVKIAEGCNRRCSFCAIPLIRGRQITRPVSSVVAEVSRMVENGVKEITLLAQDIGSYKNGSDRFANLVDAIVKTGIKWIRVFYLHPAGLSIENIRRLFAHSSVVRYLEIPVQHASTRVLRRMRRSHDKAHAENLFSAIRSDYPGAVIRSEVIVGFPGETENDFEELKAFVQEFEFESLGIFPYSREPGTESASGTDLVPEAIVRQRVEELTALQEAVSFGAHSRRVGDLYDVLVDREVDVEEGVFDGCQFAGRFYGQALGIDGEVYLETGGLRPGDFVRTRITETGIFDLKGEVIE